MQGSTGGALLTNIVITIIGIIIVLFAASFAYTKAYRAKSIIIDVIEEYNGELTSETIGDIDKQLSNVGYNRINRNCVNKKGRDNVIYPVASGKSNGYCIYKITETLGSNATVYYEVETYMYFDVPLINFSIPVYGQTISFRNTMVNIQEDDLD